ncbi:MAG: ATPase Transcriptional regulator, LuxR family [Mycobacterium sp.]|nr:ATPase Transcriptional regulator, LuxR family [Mycobacterium sp.]
MQAFSGSAWPFVGRDDEVVQALVALEDNAELQGVLLVGDSGTGKSTLVRALADDLTSRGLTVRQARGTETGKAVPLGAFYWLLDLDTAHEPAQMLAIAEKAVQQEENLVLVVDDAQWLDPLSADLVYRIAAQHTSRLIVTVRAGDPVPDSVTALCDEGLLLRLRVNAFTWEQTAELIRTTLGDAADALLVDELQLRSAGNPLMIRGLLDAGRESGAGTGMTAIETAQSAHPSRSTGTSAADFLAKLPPDAVARAAWQRNRHRLGLGNAAHGKHAFGHGRWRRFRRKYMYQGCAAANLFDQSHLPMTVAGSAGM